MKYKVWYIPQVPMKAFEVEVLNAEEAIRTFKTLIRFSIFEFSNKIKPDYSDVGGIQYFDEKSKDWEDLENLDGYEDWEELSWKN